MGVYKSQFLQQNFQFLASFHLIQSQQMVHDKQNPKITHQSNKPTARRKLLLSILTQNSPS